ncbi:MAG: hypothetical protein ACP5FT_00390 [Acidilobus sp.]
MIDVARPICASVPHHITAAFSPKWTDDPITTGSIGVGLAVEPRLLMCIGEGLTGRITETAKKVFTMLGVDHSQAAASRSLPWEMGYASSGASAVAAAMLSSVIKGVSLTKALQAAHYVEVSDRTGLGDVLAISCGIGVVLRRRPGAPGVGEAECAPAPSSVSIVALEVGQMSTRELLSSLSDIYYSKSEELVRALDRELSFDNFVQLVTQFTDSLGLARSAFGDRTMDHVKRTPGLIGYYVKKRLLVLIVERDRAHEALLHASKALNARGRLLEPSLRGPGLGWGA